ncbi:MAG: J domain-containing protein [Rhizonema sp. PD37]|nr:J domain-containing protein [Rhizonema sp. PD37]
MPVKIDRGLFKYDFVDHHAILGVPVDADVKDIRKRYLKIARFLHPDSSVAASATEKQQKSELLSKLVNPAYETLSQEKKRAEYIIVLSQIGKRLVQESASVEISSDLGKQLAGAPNIDQIYKTGIAKIAPTQYDSLPQVREVIALLSELNLVYLMRTASKSFAPPSPLAQLKNQSIPTKPDTQTPPKEDSVADLYIRRAQGLMAKNELGQAKVELQYALKLEPNNSRCHSLIGAVYLKQNLITTAKVHFDRALQLDPTDQTALEGKRRITQITGATPSTTNQKATSNTNVKQSDKSGGSGLFGGLFGGRKK